MSGRARGVELLCRLQRAASYVPTVVSVREACTKSGQLKHMGIQHPLVERPCPASPALCRHVVTVSTAKPGKLKLWIKRLGWLDHSKSKLRRSGFILYEKVCEQVTTSDISKVCDLPDTFFSWFLLTELHVWLLMVRLMAEGEEGKFTRNAMLEALWEDAEARSKKLGAASLSIRQEQMQNIGSSFQAALFAYDEGIMSDDQVLASALWRRLFSRDCSDPERLECCVKFVRRQTAYLDSLSRQELLADCTVSWVPLLDRDTDSTTR